MNRDTQSILLILLGGAVLRISLGDTYLRYVKESLQPFLIVSGVLLVALGMVCVVRDNRARRGAGPSADDGHGHAHGPAVGWLLLLPVLAIFLVAPPALGSYTAARDNAEIAEPETLPKFSPLPAPEAGVDWVPLTLTNYYTRAVWDEGATLGERPLQLTGFVTERPAGGFYLTRLRISCCAADSQSIKVVIYSDLATPPVDTWLAVNGVYTPAEPHPSEDYDEPVLTATSLQVIPAPEYPYEL